MLLSLDMEESALDIISKEPKYRINQLHQAWFNADINGYDDISTFPLELREKLKAFPWLTMKAKKMEISRKDGTIKALLELSDGLFIESVLMGREKKGKENELRHTICISSQVGCAMGCVFCATGRLGFRRNLKTEEIIDQCRFWQNYLFKESKASVDNIVIMGQGEPFLNYENIKDAINIVLKNTSIGPSKITLSTVGNKIGMEKILGDKEFPPIRIAISLHSAVEETRKIIVPSHQEKFLTWLPEWSKKYHKIFGSRAHFISLEYVMLAGINDDEKHLKALIKLASKLGNMRINLIPWNELPFEGLKGSPEETIKNWQKKITDKGFICTVRHSQGIDISAACGQLANKVK
ncbi:MAG: 23S rRNA (adenine(2503)-C(2))-methyltransferase RlmN [Patescibacteria group bacterium]